MLYDDICKSVAAKKPVLIERENITEDQNMQNETTKAVIQDVVDSSHKGVESLTRRSFIGISSLAIAGAYLFRPARMWAAARHMKVDSKAFLTDFKPSVGFVEFRNSETIVGGYRVEWWEKNFGLPLTINYAPAIHNSIRSFKKVFEEHYPQGEIRYAVKANTHPEILAIARSEGIGADVASENEMRCALEAKLPAEHIDVNGNSKTPALIEKALKGNMLLVVDSIEEFEVISGMAKKMGVRARCLMRLSGFDLGKVTDLGSFTAGSWCKFGMNIQKMPVFLDIILPKHPHMDFMGFHIHIGTQVFSDVSYRTVLGKLIEFSHRLNEKGGRCRILNLGGGFPVSYLTRIEWETELNRIREGYLAAKKGDFSKVWVWGNSPAMFMDPETGVINLDEWSGEKSYSAYPEAKMLETILVGDVTVDGKTMSVKEALHGIGNPTLIVEPGRAITETSGVSLARIKGIRTIDYDHNMITLDAGAVNYDSAVERDYLMRNWSLATQGNRKSTQPFTAFLAGRLCYNGDIIYRQKIMLPTRPSIGDILICHDTGAYSSHFYLSCVNSFARPARLMAFGDGSIKYLKSKDTYEEIFSL